MSFERRWCPTPASSNYPTCESGYKDEAWKQCLKDMQARWGKPLPVDFRSWAEAGINIGVYKLFAKLVPKLAAATDVVKLLRSVATNQTVAAQYRVGACVWHTVCMRMWPASQPARSMCGAAKLPRRPGRLTHL